MKTTLKVLAVAVKIVTIVMAMIGVIATIIVSIMGDIYVNHVYDVVEECSDLDPDDEDQDLELMSEVYRRTISDPRVMHNRFVRVVAYGVDKVASFVANL